MENQSDAHININYMFAERIMDVWVGLDLSVIEDLAAETDNQVLFCDPVVPACVSPELSSCKSSRCGGKS